MLAFKSTIFLALLSFAVESVVAVPPACLLAAVNTQKDPSDLDTLCGSASADVKSKIQSLCGDNVEAAMKAYNEVCGDTGHPTSSAMAYTTSAPGAKSTGSSSAGRYGSVNGTASLASYTAASATPIGSSSASASNGIIASNSGAKNQLSSLAAAAVALAGVVAVL